MASSVCLSLNGNESRVDRVIRVIKKSLRVRQNDRHHRHVAGGISLSPNLYHPSKSSIELAGNLNTFQMQATKNKNETRLGSMSCLTCSQIIQELVLMILPVACELRDGHCFLQMDGYEAA